MPREVSRRIAAGPLLACALLAFPLGASAASTTSGPPSASTGNVSHERGTSATLQGTVNPRGATTTYFFQYGPTVAYGSQTTPGTLAAGFATVKVGQTVAVIRAGYHYRLVASSVHGTTFGRDRSFTPKSSVLKFEFPKLQAPVTYGSPLVLSGALSGVGSADHRVQLQESPFPYLTPFSPVGLIQTTGPAGRFTFRLPGLLSSTQVRVATLDPLPLLSPVITVRVAPHVILKVRSRGRGIVRLFGTVMPAELGARVLFQLQKPVRPGTGSEKAEERTFRFATVASSVVKRATRSFSRFSTVVTLTHTGLYRAFVQLPHGNPLVSGASQSILIHGAPAKGHKKH